MVSAIITIIVIALLLIALFQLRKKKNTLQPVPATDELIKLLEKHVDFYRQLNGEEKKNFSDRVTKFLTKTRVVGVGNVQITDRDRVYVGASAIIPVFHFPTWTYNNLDEVLLYPGSFDESFHQQGDDRNVLGMVGDGAMHRVMILSLPSLRAGFEHNSAGNTGVHEFIHLVDKTDGATDGLPEYLIPKLLIEPWLKEMHKTISEIRQHGSDINPYAATSEAEFLAVVSEYFFQRPELLGKHHPELYKLLEEVYGIK